MRKAGDIPDMLPVLDDFLKQLAIKEGYKQLALEYDQSVVMKVCMT